MTGEMMGEMMGEKTGEAQTALEQQQLTQSETELGTFWHRVRSDLVTRELQRHGAGAVADVGAGAGHLGRFLRRRAPQIAYRFEEPLASVLAQLVSSFGADAALTPDLPFAGIDAVTMLDVLEHIADDGGALASIVGRMRSGALFVATVPAMPVLFSGWDVALGHHRRYTARSLRSLVDGAGLTIESCRYLFPELILPGALRRLSRRRHDGSAEFPALPRWAEAVAFRVCWLSSRGARWWPAGTSLLIVARKP